MEDPEVRHLGLRECPKGQEGDIWNRNVKKQLLLLPRKPHIDWLPQDTRTKLAWSTGLDRTSCDFAIFILTYAFIQSAGVQVPPLHQVHALFRLVLPN